ncbi:MAG: outer membrane protein assembly factor BamD [Aquificae bacterium]|nr:outer membrane protein assembly factor BamD [Aquificota bacterium]
MLKIFTVFVLFVFIFSCSEKTKYTKDLLNKGLKAYESQNYKEAKDYLKEAIYKSKGATPQDIIEAKFALADTYFKLKMYVDAIVEFEEFISLYPTSPKVPEALYKLAVSYLEISPSADRDLTYVRKAEEKARELIDNYPFSEYADKAKEIIDKAKRKEAKHYIFIAKLYENLGKPYSASVYYNFVYDEFTDYIDKSYIEFKIAQNLLNVEKQYKKEIQLYKKKISALEEKISKETDVDKKNILLNRKNLLVEHLNILENRIKEGKQRAIAILKNAYKMYPKSKYRRNIEDLLKKYGNFEDESDEHKK